MTMTESTTRHTYKLWELTDKDSTTEIYELAQVAAELHAERHGQFRSHEWDDDAKAVVYAVHRKLWDMPRIADSSRPPFTHRNAQPTNIKSLIRQAVPEWKKIWTDDEVKKLGQRVYWILVGNQLLKRMGQGAAQSYFYMRAWPEGFDPGHYSGSHINEPYFSLKDEADLARQAEKAEKLAGPVHVHYDLSSIPAPEPNPKSVMEYLEKLKVLIGKLQAENEELRQEINNRDGWGQVVNSIKGES